MALEAIFKKYERILKKDDQGNLAVFNDLYGELKNCLKSRRKIAALNSIYKRYMSMRDGCEINNGSITDAIKEMKPALL